MRCDTCDYPLWNLKTPHCPECGEPFAPAAYEFVPNSIRFCCPHCEQAYYGTGDKGHLVPSEFDCVSCGRHLNMNEMVLRPSAGITEEQTKVGFNPWLARQRIGWWKGWFATIWRALISPGRLMSGTPVSSPTVDAWKFSLTTFAGVIILALIPAMAMSLVMTIVIPSIPGAGGRGAPPTGLLAAAMAAVTAVGTVIGFVILLIYAALWVLVTHGLIRISGHGHGTLRRTCQAICYSSGTYALSVVPCFGYVAFPWWIVNAVIMVKAAHGLSGVRATFAVATFPVVLMVTFVGGYGLLIAAIVLSAGPVSTGFTSVAETQVVLDAVIGYGGTGPSHGVQLVTSGGIVQSDLVGLNTPTDTGDVPIGTKDLFGVALLDPQDQQVYVQEAIDGLPAGTVAHRVGDFVFTYHGIDPATVDSRLWLVVMTPDPDVAFSAPRFICVGQANGTVRRFSTSLLRGELATQNRLRAVDGLPPLPDPMLVRHGSPGVAPD